MPYETKILTVADVTEANRSFRPYRSAKGIEVAIAELVRNKGTHYDADVVDVCVELFSTQKFRFDNLSDDGYPFVPE